MRMGSRDPVCMTYTAISYLYVDAANYKEHGVIVVSGEMTPELQARLDATLDDGEHFVASQVNVPDLIPWVLGGNYDDEIDHGWHVMGESEPATQRQVADAGTAIVTAEELVAAFEAAAAAGWKPPEYEED